MVKGEQSAEQADAVEEASLLAAALKAPTKATPPEPKGSGKTGAKKTTKKPTKKKVEYPDPADFVGHPIAAAMNGFANKVAKVPAGTAESCGLGEAYVAMLTYYLTDWNEHPAFIALLATGQFAAVAVMVHAAAQDDANMDPPVGGNHAKP